MIVKTGCGTDGSFYSTTEDAVAGDEGEEADVGEEEGDGLPGGAEAAGQRADVGLLLRGHRARALGPRVCNTTQQGIKPTRQTGEWCR